MEYVLLVTAVVAVMIIFMVAGGANSPFQSKLTATVTKTADGMGTMADRLMNSIP